MAGIPLRILNIDDDYCFRRVTARLLALLGGHRVESAENGREGLAKALEFRPEVILLDLNMPDMSGTQVMAELRKYPATRRIPVIVITGSHLSRAGMERLKSHENFLWLEMKPVAFAGLLARIETALRGPASRSLGGTFPEASRP